MIFTTKPLKVVRLTCENPIEDFIKHELTKEEAGSLTRNAFFIRAIGVEKTDEIFSQQVKRLDDYFLLKAKDTVYLRLEELKYSLSPQETEGYIQAYEEWLKIKDAKPEEQFRLPFPAELTSDTLEWTKKCAFKEVLHMYERYMPHANASTTKNFAVKLLSWIAAYLPLLVTKERGQLGKVVYVGPIKRQEYLFLYFLFLMGCDVLYMNPQEDCLATYEEVQRTSQVYHYPIKAQVPATLVPFETYKKQIVKPSEVVTAPIQSISIQRPPQQNTTIKESGARRGSINLGGSHKGSVGNGIQRQTPRVPSSAMPSRSVPPKSNHSAEPSRPIVPNHQAPLVSSTVTTSIGNNTGILRELSYEELAQLSTSIVMITVLDGQRRAFKGGSGVVIHEEGYILTNFHVVRDGCHFEVQFENEEQSYVTSRIVKYHPNYDLALIKVEKRCKPLPLYRGEHLVRGQKVVAIGSPLGLFNTVSDGIISAFREIQDMSMIQFTAPISNGSSGGALLDMYGRLIGIITAGFDAGQNLNLAVKSEQIEYFANNFL